MRCRCAMFVAAPSVLLLLASAAAMISLAAAFGGAEARAGGDQAAGHQETFAERKARIERMSAQEKEVLLEKSQRFYEMKEEQQQRLREMHRQLSRHPEEDRLRALMLRYARWLKTLPAGERAELLSLAEDDRVARIRQIMQQQEERQFRRLVSARLPADDLKSINIWLEDLAEQHKQEILENVSQEFIRRLEEEEDVLRRRRMLLGAMAGRRGVTEYVGSEDVERLVATLSPEARDTLSKMRTDEEREDLLRDWIRAAIFARMNPPVSQEKLQEFYVNDLDSRQRQYLEGLPAERMQQELQRLYNMARFGGGDGRGRPWGGFRGDRGRGFSRSGRRGRGDGPPGGRPPFGGERPPRDGEPGPRGGLGPNRGPRGGEREDGPAESGEDSRPE